MKWKSFTGSEQNSWLEWTTQMKKDDSSFELREIVCDPQEVRIGYNIEKDPTPISV